LIAQVASGIFFSASLYGVVALSGVLLGCHTQPVVVSIDPLAIARQRLTATPRDPAVYLDLVRLSIDRHDYLRAMQYLSLAEHSALADSQAEQLFQLGLTIAIRSQNYSDAIRRCQTGLEQRESLALRRLLALLLEAHGDVSEAEHQHIALLTLYPSISEQLVEVARFYERSSLPERTAKASAMYQRYLDVAPAGAAAQQARAALLLSQQTRSKQ
jgi:hypothetical protein